MPPAPAQVTQQTVRIIPPTVPQPGRWQPNVGAETRDLLGHISLRDEERERAKAEAIAILARCTPPTGHPNTETGLVIGYVQSGKTLSFTTVTALARDNGFRLVIVIAGTSKPLFKQSTNRLVRDLRLSARPDRKWRRLENPTVRGPARAAIEETLSEWNDPTVSRDELQTVLITVMKNHQHLRKLTTLLAQLPLANVPTLVIDDEADQAGLNTLVNEQDQSTTYQRLLELRAVLPHHTYLQYTATPQAPLLINIIDILSPSFAELLTPGQDYVGGKRFFSQAPDLTRIIPAAEIPSRNNVLSGPPESLLLAMRIFLLGVAAGLVRDAGVGNRSMLVHPSQETLRHAEYFAWVRAAKTNWLRDLALPAADPDRAQLIDEFRVAYDDLQQTVDPSELPPFDSLIARLPHALRRTREIEVNARTGETPGVGWEDDYAHVLVGGQAVDRGYTVEGLTVTYMPRTLGGGNADTVQQRARFFGYKRAYLGYCRVFLEADVRDAFRSYVRHEEHMRQQLLAHRSTGQPLRDWKRTFLLSPTLRPTRAEVIDLGLTRISLSSPQFTRYPREQPAATASNRQIVADFEQRLTDLAPDDGDTRRTDVQRHLVATGVPLTRVLEELLAPYRVTRPVDSQRFTALLIHLQQMCEQVPETTCTVYVMSRGQNASYTRVRAVDTATNELGSTFQGANEPTGYPGDTQLPFPDPVCVQIHHLQLRNGGLSGPLVEDDVPMVVVKVRPPEPTDIVEQ